MEEKWTPKECIIPDWMGVESIRDDRMIVVVDEAEQKHGSLYLPTKEIEDKPQRGTIIATGPGTEQWPMQNVPGDSVLFGKYEGQEWLWADKKFLIIRQSAIILTFKPKDDEANPKNNRPGNKRTPVIR